MTDPTLATTYEWGRMYARTRGGPPTVPSITTVIGTLAQDLEWWESLCAADAAIEQAPLLAQIVAMPDGPERTDRLVKAQRWLRDAATRDRDQASVRGDAVHDYAEQVAKQVVGLATDADIADAEARCLAVGADQYLRAFERFWRRFRPVPVMVEATVWSGLHAYAGTTDMLCLIDLPGEPGVPAVLDWKTKKALYMESGRAKVSDVRDHTAMQLAATAYADEVWVRGATPELDTWEPMRFVPEVGVGVAIAPDGATVRQFDIYDPLVWDSFLALRRAWEFKREGALRMSPRVQSPASLKRMSPPPPQVVARGAQNPTPQGLPTSPHTASL